MMSAIKFYVIENNNPFSISDMSEPESFAIRVCVDELAPQPQEHYWFEVDTCLFDEDEPEYGILRCYEQNPNPRNDSQSESRIPYPLPKELLDALEGKTFRVYPRQYGLNPWGEKVEIRFENLTKKGVKASDLIAAALQTQKLK